MIKGTAVRPRDEGRSCRRGAHRVRRRNPLRRTALAPNAQTSFRALQNIETTLERDYPEVVASSPQLQSALSWTSSIPPAWFRRLYSAGSSPGNNFAVLERVENRAAPAGKLHPPAGKLRQDLADDASGLDAGQFGL